MLKRDAGAAETEAVVIAKAGHQKGAQLLALIWHNNGMMHNDSKWIDLYTVLDVDSDANEETLRKSLRQYESQSKDELHRKAVTLWRRILLDSDCRARYNRLRAQHRSGNPAAMDFQTFASVIHNSDLRQQMAAAEAVRPIEVALPHHFISGAPALSRTSVHLLTGFVATLQTTFIQTGTSILPGV